MKKQEIYDRIETTVAREVARYFATFRKSREDTLVDLRQQIKNLSLAITREKDQSSTFYRELREHVHQLKKRIAALEFVESDYLKIQHALKNMKEEKKDE